MKLVQCFFHALGKLGVASPLLAMCFSMTAALADQFQRKPVEEWRYEDRFTFQPGNGTYTVDPWVWAYTQEFADKFRMPQKWVDKDLKGILAVAFRMTRIGNMMCGYGGKEDNCWPMLECQLDVYYDNRIKLPWTHEEIKQDFLMQGVSSREFLHDPSDSKGYRRYKGSGVFPSLGGLNSGKARRWQQNGGNILFFDREFQPKVGLLSWGGIDVCPEAPSKGQILFYDYQTTSKILKGEIMDKNAKPMRTFDLSESFMRRANAVYEDENKQNREAAQRLIQQFFESRKAKQ